MGGAYHLVTADMAQSTWNFIDCPIFFLIFYVAEGGSMHYYMTARLTSLKVPRTSFPNVGSMLLQRMRITHSFTGWKKSPTTTLIYPPRRNHRYASLVQD